MDNTEKIHLVLSLLKQKWRFAAYDLRGWKAYAEIPKYRYYKGDLFGWEASHKDWYGEFIEADLDDFDIPPFDGEWQFSLITRQS